MLAQVIRFYPRVAGVWIYAAAWEFDHNLNVAAARALMQNGLRVCPTSEDLWIEYLRMELTYLNKLKARKIALGIGENENENEEMVDADADQKEKEEEGTVDHEKEFLSLESEKKLDLFREQGLRLLRTIYSGAVEALPSSFGLRKRLFQILEATDLAHSQDNIREELLSDMKRDFSKEPEYWDWLARLQITDSNDAILIPQVQKAVQV